MEDRLQGNGWEKQQCRLFFQYAYLIEEKKMITGSNQTEKTDSMIVFWLRGNKYNPNV